MMISRIYKYLKRKLLKEKQYTFQGVYDSLEDAKSLTSNGYEDTNWIENMYHEAKEQLHEVEQKSTSLPIAKPGSRHHELLPFLLATISSNKEIYNVVDVGGGFGVSYINSMIYTNISKKIKFHIIETLPMYTKGKELFKENDNIYIYHSIPKDLQNIDVINIGSALQYVNNYSNYLQELLSMKPTYLLLTDHFMGEMKTYTTKQINMPGVEIAYQIFNLQEIVEIIAKQGYTLVYQSTNYQDHPFNVPVEYKVDSSCNLLFSRNKT